MSHLRSWLFRALNRCDTQYPRFERALETSATLAAIAATSVVMCVGLVRAMLCGDETGAKRLSRRRERREFKAWLRQMHEKHRQGAK